MKQAPGSKLGEQFAGEREPAPAVQEILRLAQEKALEQARKTVGEHIGEIQSACGGIETIMRQVTGNWKAASISDGDRKSFVQWHLAISSAVIYFTEIGAMSEHGRSMDSFRIRMERLAHSLTELNATISAALQSESPLSLNSAIAQKANIPNLLKVVQLDAQGISELLQPPEEQPSE